MQCICQLFEVSLDWCYNKIASRFKVRWNQCHIVSSKLALVNGNLPQLSLRGGGWQQQQKCGFKSDFVLFQSSLQTMYFGQMQANYPGVEFSRTIYPGSEREENFVMAFLHPPKNGKLVIFMSLLCSDGKEMYKKVCCTCNVFFLLIEPIDVMMFFSPSPSSNLKTPCISLVNRLWMPLMSFLRFWMPEIQWDVDVHRCLTLEFSLIIFHCNFFKC